MLTTFAFVLASREDTVDKAGGTFGKCWLVGNGRWWHSVLQSHGGTFVTEDVAHNVIKKSSCTRGILLPPEKPGSPQRGFD